MVKAKPSVFGSVPRLFPGETVVCIGGGPSLTPEDVNYCHGKARVIAINDAYKLAPWADVLYACDAKWWRWEKNASAEMFAGLKYSLGVGPKGWHVQTLQNTGREGLELQPTGVKTGTNSGYQAINLAVHLGATRIVLLGYDMQKQGGLMHWHGDHPQKSTPAFVAWIAYFTKLAPILKKHGVEVINCSRRTALTCFQKAALETALPDTLAVAV